MVTELGNCPDTPISVAEPAGNRLS